VISNEDKSHHADTIKIDGMQKIHLINLSKTVGNKEYRQCISRLTTVWMMLSKDLMDLKSSK